MMNMFFDFAFYYIVIVVIILGVMIFCHELGHFLLAKLFNVRVLKFALGFGPKIVWKQIGETEYSIRWIPLGGFVKLLGEDDDEEIKKLPPEEAARSLDRQSPLKKIAILSAGSIFNLISAVLIFTGIFFFVGEAVYHLQIMEVFPNQPAQQAGLLPNDLIMKLQGKIIKSPRELEKVLIFSGGEPLSLTILRDNAPISIQVTPQMKMKNIEGEEIKSGIIGIQFKPIPVEHFPLDMGKSLLRGLQGTWEVIEDTFKIFKKLFQGHIPYRAIGSIVGVAKTTGEIAKRDPVDLFPLTAWLSITIGILNLLPIPALDGSYIVIVMIEVVRRKRLSATQKEWLVKIGFAFLITLMLFATYNDIVYRILKYKS